MKQFKAICAETAEDNLPVTVYSNANVSPEMMLNSTVISDLACNAANNVDDAIAAIGNE